MGVTFAVFLIVEQGGAFTGLMRRSGAIILDTQGVDLWVFDSRVKTVDDLRALKDSDLWRVRDVEVSNGPLGGSKGRRARSASTAVTKTFS
jgi:hypothetical protein